LICTDVFLFQNNPYEIQFLYYCANAFKKITRRDAKRKFYQLLLR